MLPTWAVATLTRNTQADFCRYVAWYLEQGASKLHLYFHNPEDPNIELVEGHPRVDVVKFTPQLMEALRIKEDNLGLIQNNIGTHAYRRTEADWILRCDIDELIYFEDGSEISELLGLLKRGEVESIRLEMVEELRGGKEGSPLRFRKAIAEQNLNKVYGDIGPLVASRHGLIGHRRGKAISRCGLPDLAIHTHAAKYHDREKRTRELSVRMLTPACLLHFNSGTLQEWVNSLSYRVDFSSFDATLAERLKELVAMGEDGIPEVHRIYRALNEFDEDRFSTLQQLGSAIEVEIDIDDLVSKYFPGGGKLQ